MDILTQVNTECQQVASLAWAFEKIFAPRKPEEPEQPEQEREKGGCIQ